MMPIRRSTRATRNQKTWKLEEEADYGKVSNVKETKVKKDSASYNSHKRAKVINILKHDPKLTDEDEVRCLACGLWNGNYEEEDDEKRDPKFDNWIQCDKCKLWQHTFCMFGDSNFEAPTDYKCDVCNSNNPLYANFKRKMAYNRWLKLRFPNGNTGVAPSYEDLDEFEVEIEEGKREDEDEDEDVVFKDGDDADEGDDDKIMEDDDDDDDEEGEKIRSRKVKRKLEKETKPKRVIHQERKKKGGTKKSNLIEIKRQGIIQGFSKLIAKLLPKDDIEFLKERKIEDISLQWATTLESIIHDIFPDDNQYISKCRSLLQNIKSSNLVERVINGEFKLEQLPRLSNEEMKTNEEKERDKLIREKELNKSVIKQSINLVPQVKITRKGEEVLENADYQFDDPSSNYVNDKRIEEVERIKDEKLQKEREEKITRESSIDQFDNEDNLRNVFHANAAGYDLDDDNQFEEINGQSEAVTSNTDFVDNDDDDEFDKIINGNNAKENTKSSDEKETEEKEPHQQQYEFKEIWKGEGDFGPTTLNVKIRFISSNDSKESESKVSQIFEDTIKIKHGKITLDGRLDSKVADKYLNKVSQTRDFYLYEIKPESEEMEKRFGSAFKFYFDKRKYGVIGTSPDYIKDIYIIAKDKNTMVDNRPTYFGKLDFEKINDSLNDKGNFKMYILFVVSREMSFSKEDRGVEEEDDYEPSISARGDAKTETDTLPADTNVQLQNILDSLKGSNV